MNKVQITITFLVIAVFIGLIVVTQSGSSSKNITQVPTLPPESSTFKLITPSAGAQGPQARQQQGQQAAPTWGVEEGVKASYSATIKTSKGTIEAIISGKDAPRTVKNFVAKAGAGFYNNLTWHRVEDWVIQGGDPKGDGTGGGMMQTEINAIPFSAGSLGIARGADIRISNDSQFFIVKQESPHLNQQYTNFGQVTKGMDVVNSMKVGDKILSVTVK